MRLPQKSQKCKTAFKRMDFLIILFQPKVDLSYSCYKY